MTPSRYIAEAMRTAGPALTFEEAMSLCGLGLAGEAGEFADRVKKYLHHGHPWDKSKAISELGDVMWYVARTCHALDLTLEELMTANIAKLRERYGDAGFSKEASLNRKEGT